MSTALTWAAACEMVCNIYQMERSCLCARIVISVNYESSDILLIDVPSL